MVFYLYKTDNNRVESINDFVSCNSRKLMFDNALSLYTLDELFNESEAIGEEFEVDLRTFKGLKSPPRVYLQMIASAVIHYELASRDKFNLILNHAKKDLILSVGLSIIPGTEYKRGDSSIDQCLFVANQRVEVAEQIYGLYHEVNR